VAAYGIDVADVVSGAVAYDPPAVVRAPRPAGPRDRLGHRESTAAQAAAAPDTDHLAVEVFEPGLAQLLMRIEDAALTNLRLLRGDAVDLLRNGCRRLPGRGADLLPDPWPKRRHHKRRLVQPGFVALVASRLAPGGVLHLATDWAHYASQMWAACAGEPLLENTSTSEDGWTARPAERPETKFERRARSEGRDVRDLVFRRIVASATPLLTDSHQVGRLSPEPGAFAAFDRGTG
jgi:tRNA (guanine-N7-)-methyltransferase